MKHIYRTIIAGIFLILCIGQLHAQKVGTTSLQFLKVMPTARATAMGDAYVSLANGSDAVFWNPAGLTTIENHELSFTNTMWLFDTKQLALSYGLSMGDWGNLGFQIQYVDYGTMKETRPEYVELVVTETGEKFFNSGLTGRSFTPYAGLVGISYARALTDQFSAAATVKYATESLWSDPTIMVLDDATGKFGTFKTYTDVVLFDFGMIYNTGYRSIKVGVSVQNFGSQVRFAEINRSAPLAFRLGASGDVFGQDALLFRSDVHRFTVSYDLFQPNDYRQQMHIGAEYSAANVLDLRAGYKVDYDSEGLTLGGGVHTDISGWRVAIDYSFGKMSEYLNNVSRITLGVQIR